VLSGGLSSEREISARSAACVARALRSRGYDVCEIVVDRALATTLAEQKIDVAFNALHGRYGEDGCVQGLLEVLGIPYTGTGVLGSALAMDKWASKQLLAGAGIPTPPATLVGPCSEVRLPGELPVVVKPRSEGSSNGVTLVRAGSDLEAALAESRRLDPEALIEQYVPGREITVAVLEDRALAAMEVVPLGDELHTYEVKYTPGRERFVVPAPIGERPYEQVLDLALSTHRALFAGAYSRVDLRLRDDGELFVLECNTLPGLHELGWFPAMAAHAGIAFPDLIELLLERSTLGVRETRLEDLA
jgi:D-alanine-D-alanine ligase